MSRALTVGRDMTARILVVEDEANIADYLVIGLREEGYTVEHAADGDRRPAIACESGSWDLVLLDWWLPGEDGLALLRRFRERDRRTPGAVPDGPRPGARTACSASTAGPTTTCASRSTSTSCWPASAP